MEVKGRDRSLGELFGDLSRQLNRLVHQEIELAKTEMTTKATTVGRDAAVIAAGGALAYAALLIGLVAIALLLVELGLAGWLAFLVVAALAGLVAAALIGRGRADLKKADLAPRQTMETLKEDAEWAKDQVR